MSLDLVTNELIPKQRAVYELGLVYDQWAYVVIKNKIPIQDEALLGPFDLLTWMLIVIFLVLLSAEFIFSVVTGDEKTYPSLIWIPVIFYGAMLDQGVHSERFLILKKFNGFWLGATAKQFCAKVQLVIVVFCNDLYCQSGLQKRHVLLPD